MLEKAALAQKETRGSEEKDNVNKDTQPMEREVCTLDVVADPMNELFTLHLFHLSIFGVKITRSINVLDKLHEHATK